jgi:hypothetical protein
VRKTVARCIGFAVGAFLWAGGAREARAATRALTPSDDTFINAGNPGNNNGASLSFFTGTDGRDGVMRALLRFAMPSALQGRVTVTGVQLVLTIDALGDGTAGTGATETLRAVLQPWVQGNGFGNTVMAFTVGQACSGTIFGATWNQANCATGTIWSTAGATVASTVSAQASTVGVPIGGPVTWDSAANPALLQDVQSWIDNPTGNFGWRMSSSTEGNGTQAQRFFSTESGTTIPTLTITYACNPGFVASGNDCIAAVATPAAGGPASALLAMLLCAAAWAGLRRSGPDAAGRNAGRIASGAR